MGNLHRRVGGGVLLLGVAGACVTCETPASAGQQCKPSSTVNGVDLNADGETLNWVSAAGDGVQFAIVKATQGTGYTDSDFASSWSALKAAGVTRGAYHFFDATVSGVAQANFFLSVMGPLEPGDLPPTLDIECPTSNSEPNSDDCLGNGTSGDATGAEITQEMNDFLTTVAAATGRTPIVYSYNSWFSDVGVTTTDLENYPLWIADYSGTSCFSVPSPWTTATFWQWGDSTTYSGIGSVDADYFLGSFAQLTAFTSAPASDGGTKTSDAGTPAFTGPAQVNGNDALSLVNWADGHIELYAMGTGTTASRIDSTLTGTPADTWSAPVTLGGSASCGVASVYWAAGSGHTSEVFDGLANGTVESLEYVSSSSTWTSFSGFGGVGLSHLSTLAYPDGHVEVFAYGNDGNVWHNVSTQSSWGGWSTLGGVPGTFATGASAILWNDGHAEAFATDKNGAAWRIFTGTSLPPVWGQWSQLSGPSLATRPIPARWSDGHVQLFARGTDDHLYTSDYDSGAYSAFSVLNASQTIAGEPSLLVYASYGPEIFARDASGDLIHMWNTVANAGQNPSWSTWANDFGEVIASDPMAWMRPDGLAEVFAVDGNGDVVKTLHAAGTWTPFATIATSMSPCVGGTTLMDAGVPVVDDAGVPVIDDAGTPMGSSDGGIHIRVGPPDGGVTLDGGPSTPPTAHEAGKPDAAAAGSSPSSSGCSCRTGTGTNAGGEGESLALLLIAIACTSRRQSAQRRRKEA